MNLTNEFQPIRQWAQERGLLEKGDPKTQTVKLGEEYGELCRAVNKGKKEDARDAIGDMIVVLTSIAYHMGYTVEWCINDAFAEIKDRKGNMVNGDFQKD